MLVKGADILVSGASSLAQKLKISPIVIGLTIVAFGTSAPELVVSVVSALNGSTEIALGNVIGSNISNILLILGASAIVYPLKVHKNTIFKEIPMSLLATFVLVILAFQFVFDTNFSSLYFALFETVGNITRSNGLILLSFFIIFIYYTFGIARVTGDVDEKIEERKLEVSILLVLIGIVGLGIGSQLFVENSINLAGFIGVSETLIGLTVVALGTSMPELVTSVVAAYKKRTDIAIGNVIGSNIFNILLVLGVTSLINDLPLPGIILTDILILLGATFFLYIMLYTRERHTLSRFEGSLMLVAYFGYFTFVILRG